MTATSSGADLQQLMMIAELYARKLVADDGPPSRVLMLERHGELDFVVLDGQERDAAAQARRLLARHGAPAAVLLFETQATVVGVTQAMFCVLGETNEGATAARRYRVRPWGHRRRLTLLSGSEETEAERVFRSLFPIHLRPHRSDDAPADPLASATPALLPATGAPLATGGRIVAA